jgi:hypothetical protein
MNKPLPRSRYGKAYNENYDRIFDPPRKYLIEVWSKKEDRAIGWSGTEEGAKSIVLLNNLRPGEYTLKIVEVQE